MQLFDYCDELSTKKICNRQNYFLQFFQETRLYQIAERCMSSVLNEDEVAHCSGTLRHNLSDTVSQINLPKNFASRHSNNFVYEMIFFFFFMITSSKNRFVSCTLATAALWNFSKHFWKWNKMCVCCIKQIPKPDFGKQLHIRAHRLLVVLAKVRDHLIVKKVVQIFWIWKKANIQCHQMQAKISEQRWLAHMSRWVTSLFTGLGLSMTFISKSLKFFRNGNFHIFYRNSKLRRCMKKKRVTSRSCNNRGLMLGRKKCIEIEVLCLSIMKNV